MLGARAALLCYFMIFYAAEWAFPNIYQLFLRFICLLVAMRGARVICIERRALAVHFYILIDSFPSLAACCGFEFGDFWFPIVMRL